MATASDLTAGVRGTVRNLASAVRNMGAAMTVGAGLAGAALVSLTQKAERVSSAFREVDTLVQGTSNAQEKYGQLVTDLNTKFGLQADKLEVIEGLYQSVSAGIEQTEESQREFLSTAAELAVVGRVDLGTSVDVLSTVMNTYGYETSRAEDISETMFQTVQFGKTRMEELAPVIGRVAALGSNLGVQIDEIGASMAVLTRTGFGARVAATGLRNIFRSMLKPSGAMQETLFQIASEQDFFASSFEDSSERIKGLAKDFREASEAVDKFSQKQEEARSTQENASTAIQEARLKITAIEENRLDQLPELTKQNVKEADSVKELESIISDYQFTVNKARLQEEKFRKEKEEAQAGMENYKSQISDIIAESGDFQGGIGQLILENQNFVETLSKLKQEVNNTETSMTDLFPRTRALQGALALAGEDGSRLRQIFSNMQDDGYDAADAWDNMDESVRENFDSREEFMGTMDQMQAGDMSETYEKALGPQQKMRNSMSKLQEAMSGLGQVFTEDVVESMTSFADTVTRVVEKFENMEKGAREGISQFAVLAVSIGLVLGPLLFFGGQLAIIASTMGTALIPVGIALAGLLGVFATALSSAASEGEDADGMLGSMQGTFSGLIDFVLLLKTHFVGVLLPALKFLGNTFISIFNEIKSQFAESGDIEGLDILVFRLAWALREGVAAIGKFLKNNKELIASLVVLAVDTFLNKIIPAVLTMVDKFVNEVLPVLSDVATKAGEELVPALFELAGGIFAVVKNVDFGSIVKFASAIAIFIPIIADIITWIGKFLQNNAELIGTLVTIAAKVAIVVLVATKFVAILASLILKAKAVIVSIKLVAIAVGMLIAPFGGTATVVSTLAAMFPNLAIVMSAIVTAAKAVGAAVAALAAFLGLPVWATLLLIAALTALVAAIWVVRDELVAMTKELLITLMDIYGIILDFFTSDMGMKEAGKKIIERLAEGMLKGVSLVKKAAGKIAQTVMDFFPSSPAKTGPIAETPPADSGEEIGEGLAGGLMDSKGEAEIASGDFATNLKPDEEDMDFDMSEYDFSGEGDKSFLENYSSTENFEGEGMDMENMSKSGSGMGMGGMGGETYEVTFKESSIEVGPFHGISDEELPEKVRKEVNRSLQDVIDEVRGSGKDATSSMAPGGQSGI